MKLETLRRKYKLQWRIGDRGLRTKLPRYWASFDSAEVKDVGMLINSYGNGDTKAQAKAAYAPEICGKRLVIGAYRPSRFEFDVPDDLTA